MKTEQKKPRKRRGKVELGKVDDLEATKLVEEVQLEIRNEIAVLAKNNTERQLRARISSEAATRIANTVFDASAQASYSVKRTTATRADVEALKQEMQQLLDQVATGDLSAIRDKLVGQIAVLDAIFHQAAREATTCIPGSHQQQRVLKLAQDVQNQFLKASLTLEHFRAPVRLPERVDVSRLDAWLIQRAQQLGTTRILVSQLARFGPVEYRSGQGREVALDVLEKANRIRVVERDDASGHVIEINPRLLALEEMESSDE